MNLPSFENFTMRALELASVPVGHEDVAVGSDDHVGGPVERVRAVARDAGLAERHQHFAVRAELEHLLALAISALASVTQTLPSWST